MRALIDQEQGWHKTLSNVPLPDIAAGTGVIGATKDISFDIQDADCDANQLNAARITTLVPISGRLRFWGSRTATATGDFVFESYTRTAHILADTVAISLVDATDKPLIPAFEGGIDRAAGGPLDRITRLLRDLSGAMVLGAATPALASGLLPLGSPRGMTSGGTDQRTYNITVNAGVCSPADIEAAVRRAIESVEREHAARQRSQFADAPDWNV